MAIRLVLADDHPVVLAGLKDYFSAEPDLEILACVRNGDEALDAVRRLRPDVLVLDLRMPVKDGLTVLQQMKSEQLPTSVVILTAHNSDDAVESAVRLGARGVMLKDVAPTLLVECVREVHAGRKWLERGLATRAVEKLLERESGIHARQEALTRREIEVARMAAEGLSSKLIARKLSITEGTAKIHLHHVYEKLKINGRMALVRYMRSMQLD